MILGFPSTPTLRGAAAEEDAEGGEAGAEENAEAEGLFCIATFAIDNGLQLQFRNAVAVQKSVK